MGYVTDWVDAFASEPLAGNGCAVVHDAGNLTDEICIKFVRETSLSECTFLEPSKKADVKVRYFLASGEIPFAGHPTVATVLSLLHQGKIAGGPLTLETGAGIIPIRIDHSSGKPKVVMTQIAPEFGPVLDPKTIADCGSIEPTDIISPPQIVSTGIPFCISVVKDHSVLHKLKANPQATEIAKEKYSPTDWMEPFWVSLQGISHGADTFSRLLMLPPNPAEDPFTGSATGAMAAYLWHHGLIKKPSLIAEQGHWMDRPGQAHVTVLGPAEAITGVEVAGSGHVLMSGQLLL
ncbi:MAG: PhzF family phenazine biosynthesis protein [Marinovum sp.]|nr:PhzF family phenazine biosynthesis protein [Marinovum sp.]MBT6531902.1 PhzF family phenazine biosynthesis protein [Marinovum sp.]MBT7907866.1 PhzF family phenazine biosynthesis protein [Marinovum sp.]